MHTSIENIKFILSVLKTLPELSKTTPWNLLFDHFNVLTSQNNSFSSCRASRSALNNERLKNRQWPLHLPSLTFSRNALAALNELPSYVVSASSLELPTKFFRLLSTHLLNNASVCTFRCSTLWVVHLFFQLVLFKPYGNEHAILRLWLQNSQVKDNRSS